MDLVHCICIARLISVRKDRPTKVAKGSRIDGFQVIGGFKDLGRLGPAGLDMATMLYSFDLPTLLRERLLYSCRPLSIFTKKKLKPHSLVPAYEKGPSIFIWAGLTHRVGIILLSHNPPF